MTDTEFLFLKCLSLCLIGVNLFAMILTIADKHRAKKGAWRVPENTLLFFGAIGGALCEWITMLCIRHKTKHMKFMILLPLFLAVHIALLTWYVISFIL